MIPYDDLVAALSAWRARQGLPVSALGGGAAAPSPGSGPHAQPGSGPTRGAPPAPPGRAKQPSVPPPLAATDEMHEVDDGELIEEQYENEGSDFAMSFGAGGGGNGEGESTAIGGAPERPTAPDFDGGRGGGRGGRDDW